MEYFHSLTSLSATNLADKFKKQIHYVQAVLQIVNLILTWNKSESQDTVSYPFLYITGNGNANRVYIVKPNSIVSFLFPLGISLKTDAVGTNNWTINKRDVVLNLPVVSKCIDFANSIGQKKSPAKIIDIAKSISPIDRISNIAFDLLEFLLLIEPCYIRFDDDPQHSNKYVHPKRHFDINFSVDGTYKIGVFAKIKIDEFKDVLEKTTNSWYAIKPKIPKKRFVHHKSKGKHKSVHKRRYTKPKSSLRMSKKQNKHKT